MHVFQSTSGILFYLFFSFIVVVDQVTLYPISPSHRFCSWCFCCWPHRERKKSGPLFEKDGLGEENRNLNLHLPFVLSQPSLWKLCILGDPLDEKTCFYQFLLLLTDRWKKTNLIINLQISIFQRTCRQIGRLNLPEIKEAIKLANNCKRVRGFRLEKPGQSAQTQS